MTEGIILGVVAIVAVVAMVVVVIAIVFGRRLMFESTPEGDVRFMLDPQKPMAEGILESR